MAGLRFWQLAASESGDDGALPQALHGGEGLIRDYLLEEVIDILPAAVQAFLYDTACQERFAPNCVTPCAKRDDSAEVLRYLQAHQVFLVPLDEHGRWFRYHHLFSDLLRSRQASGPLASQHLRASRWFESQGLLDEAVEQALRAGHLDVAADLVQSLSEEQLLAEQNVGMLLRWKMDLPDSLLISTPRLIVLYSWALGLACQLDAAEELAGYLSRFLPAPSATAQRSMLAQWLALSGVIARGRGDRQRTFSYCSEALQSLPCKRYGQRLVCLSTLSNLAIADGDFWRARGWNREALSWRSGSATHCSKRWPTTTGPGCCTPVARCSGRWMKCARACSACRGCRASGCMRCVRGSRFTKATCWPPACSPHKRVRACAPGSARHAPAGISACSSATA